MKPQVIMITGANTGLGKDAARQFALLSNTKKVYLACRNLSKAEKAKEELEKVTQRDIFEVFHFNPAQLSSIQQAVGGLTGPIDVLIMNAGGFGGKRPGELTPQGVTHQFEANVTGHAKLAEALVEAGKLKQTAVYVSSEVARGVKSLQAPAPELKSHSVEEIQSIATGRYFDQWDPMTAYGHTKYIGTLWMYAFARKYPELKCLTITPGSTKGTEAVEDFPAPMRFMFKYIMMPLVMPLRGMVHSLETGAKRYVDVAVQDRYKSGKFYGSEKEKITGKLVEQEPFLPSLQKLEYQENAYQAVQSYIG